MSFDNPVVVDVIYGLSALAFFAFLIIGASATIARVAYYRVMGWKRPRLLIRDMVLIGGFALSVAFIFAARVLGATNLRNNVLWALVTSLPIVVAVGTYAWFEVFVIERPKPGSTMRDDPYLRPREPEVPHLEDDQ